MEPNLTLYRRHTAACSKQYPPDHRITEARAAADHTLDCNCPIVASEHLPKEKKRILHRSMGTKDWFDARKLKVQWPEWGQTTETSDLTWLDPQCVTVEDAVRFFREFHQNTYTKGKTTFDKYDVLFDHRVLPWCKARAIRLIKEFGNPVVVKKCFMSWRNLQPIRGSREIARARPFGLPF